MGIFDGCLITSDVDDTLVSSGWINPKNIEKIEFFIKEGGMFSVATGRTANAVGMVTSALKRFSPSVVANGGMIYDYTQKEILYEEYLPREEHKLLEEVIERGIKVGCEIHSGIDSFTLMRNSETDFHQTYECFSAPDCEFKDIDSRNWNKVVFFSEDISVFDRIKKLGETLGVQSDFVSTRMVAPDMVHNFLELVPRGISKATAIKKLRTILGIKAGCSFAIGDYYNDVAMLNDADIAAVTAGAPDDIKAISDYVTVSCEEGAVADFIDYLTEKYIK